MFSLLYRNLTVAYFCWLGWLELYGMMVSVNVRFLYTENFQFVGVLWMVLSRKFIWLSVSCSAINNIIVNKY